MRGFVRPDTTQSRPYGASGVYPGITPWQFPVGKTLYRQNLMRAGTAPLMDEGKVSQVNKPANKNIKEAYRNYLLQGAHSRHNGPVKVASKLRLNNPSSKPTSSNSRDKESPSQLNVHNSARKIDIEAMKDSKLKLGVLEAESLEEESSGIYPQRPPCRQSDMIFDLDDRILTVNIIQSNTAQDKNERTHLRNYGDLRPPSRHKSPTKSIGLDFPPASNYSSQTALLNIASYPYEENFLDVEMQGTFGKDDIFMRTLPLNNELRRRETVNNPHTNSFKKVSARKLSRPGLKIYEYESDNIPRKPALNKRKKSTIREEPNTDSFNMRTSTATSKPSSHQIPIIINRRESTNRMFYTRKHNNEPHEEEVKRVYQTDKKLSSVRRVPSQSYRSANSPSKQRTSQTLPFTSSLDSEFLGMFAKDDFI